MVVSIFESDYSGENIFLGENGGNGLRKNEEKLRDFTHFPPFPPFPHHFLVGSLLTMLNFPIYPFSTVPPPPPVFARSHPRFPRFPRPFFS